MVRNLDLILSVIFLLYGVFRYLKNNYSLKNRIAFSILFLISIILYILYGVSDYFTGKGIDESVIYHIKYGLSGAGFSEYSGLIIITSIILFLGLLFAFFIFLKKEKDSPSSAIDKNLYFSYVLVLISLIANPAVHNLYNTLCYKPYVCDFDIYYHKPAITKLDHDQKNFIMIYAESLERTYFDEATFPGLIKELRKLESQSTYFTNIVRVPYTGWTIGGIVASQCGIPLEVPPNSFNSMSGMDRFLPSAVGLSDLLHREGYKLVYYGGADLDFAGKGKFLRDHHYDEVFGVNELLGVLTDKSYRNGWGLYDDTLFDIAFDKFIMLSEQDKKFGLVLLTLDTHHPDGSPSKKCDGIIYGDGSNPILNAVACSDHLISAFINKILQSPFAQNTIIVVLSDHLALKNSAYNLLERNNRTNMFMIIAPQNLSPRKIQRQGSTLDVGATLLPFIGFRGSLGLGRNLLDKGVSDLEIKQIQALISAYAWKRDLSRFWDFPRIKESITIDITNSLIGIDGREFKLPILIEFNDDFRTVLRFNSSDKGWEAPKDYWKGFNKNKNFILIDKCKNVNEIDQDLGQDVFCMIIGRGVKNLKKMVLYKNITLTTNDLRDILHLKDVFHIRRIAHGGGGIDKATVTNSFQALDHNLKRGFLYFELDFSYTKDRQLVCLHDFKQTFKRLTRLELKERPTLVAFQSIVHDNCRFDLCTIDTLAAWMKENPSATIITDVKDDDYMEALKTISTKLPNFEDRVIPQVYHPEDYARARHLGYKQIIWTLYRYTGTNEDVLKWVDSFEGPFAITMPKERAVTDLPAKLAQKEIPSYVHTVNDKEEANIFIKRYKITDIYTDYLSPE